MKNLMIGLLVACPDQSKSADSETLWLAFHHQGPTFSNAYCQGATHLADQDRGRGNDLPRQRRSALSECFI